MPELKVYQSWSAPILHTLLPNIILQELIYLTDIITEDKEKQSHSNMLVGELEDEWTIDPVLLINISFKNYIKELCWEYFKIMLSQYPSNMPKLPTLNNIMKDIEITSAWFNNQKDNEYNPAHVHSGTFSGVLYLKIPKYLPSRKKEHLDGSICFIGNSSENDEIFTTPDISIQPKVGDIFLFPSTTRHQVYPFRTEDGKGIRRSLSFNLDSKMRMDKKIHKVEIK